MYAYRESTIDKNLGVGEKQFVAGVAIGIILFGKTGYSLPPGSVENATTFDFPVYYKGIDAASVESVVSSDLDPEVLRQLIKAGKEMQEQGCRAIIGACGYFANYLPEVKKELDVPCFFSSLMQIPLILCSIQPSKKLGILCADGRVLTSAPALANCGVPDKSRLVISGAEVLPEMQKILEGTGGYNPLKLEEGLVDLAREMVKSDPDIGAILLECTLFPTHASAVQEAVRLPVFDFSTLINWVYSAVVRRGFSGYL
jgi:hypothetical protein